MCGCFGRHIWRCLLRTGGGSERDDSQHECCTVAATNRSLLSSALNTSYHRVQVIGRTTADSQHRLGNSGIRNVYYIVEDFQVAERMEYNGLQIQTAKSQIQVHNRFFLKETHKLSETIDFLCTMTKVIQTSLAGKELRVIPTKYLSRPTYSALQARLRGGTNGDYLTSFEAYQALNDKSASITLKDKFARMLMCVKGMSAEKVAAVLDVWETPRAMWEDLRGEEKRFKLEARAREAAGALHGDGQGEGNKENKGKGKKKEVVRGKEMFFADRVKGEGRRKIGDALSREVSWIRCMRPAEGWVMCYCLSNTWSLRQSRE